MGLIQHYINHHIKQTAAIAELDHPRAKTRWIVIGLLVLGNVGTAAQVTALPLSSDRVPAQRLAQVIEGLPPPPLIPAGFGGLPAVEPSSPPSAAPLSSPYLFPNAAPATPATPLEPQYLVLVNGASELLLEQVRKVDSGAFLQTHQGREVIQAGAFSESDRANQQAQVLESQGIVAEVVPILNATYPTAQSARPTAALPAVTSPPTVTTSPPAATVLREVPFGELPDLSPSGSETEIAQLTAADLVDNSYYVTIPGALEELRSIAVRITQLASGLNVQERSIQERSAPLGPHVLVGPFVDRGVANRWNRYFQNFGLLDARVYYRR